jgi:hypothetical protein
MVCVAPPVLEPAEHPLDIVATPVGRLVERKEAPTGWLAGDDGRGSALVQERVQAVSVVGGVGQSESS